MQALNNKLIKYTTDDTSETRAHFPYTRGLLPKREFFLPAQELFLPK